MSNPSSFHVAQFNIAWLQHPVDDPRSAGFTDNISKMKAIARRSSGFVAELEFGPEEGPDYDPALVYGSDPLLTMTLSVWQSSDDLYNFVYKTVHSSFVRRRLDWFEAHTSPAYVLWHIPSGTVPTLPTAKSKLDLLTANGATAEAFDFAYLSAKTAV